MNISYCLMIVFSIHVLHTLQNCAAFEKYFLKVNTSLTSGSIRPFWRSTGFCPPLPHQNASQFDLSADMIQNIAYLGAIPHSGMKQVRIHWLLDLITIVGFNNSIPIYNFTYLDDLIDMLFVNGLQPGFEIMGNPSKYFNDFENRTQVYLWRDLVQKLAHRYVEIYGIDHVKKWNFESWNEPDCHDFDHLKFTLQGFINYYDACSEGLKSVSPLLLLGGPGDGCKSTKYAFYLLDHCQNGINYFTGERGVRIDFISFHKKGNGTAKGIFDGETKIWEQIKEKFPYLANKPFYNDEADPLVGWSKNEWWRADATYAALVVKVIIQHQNMILANPGRIITNYTLLSNDNAFLSWYPHQFTQRTLLARFQMNNTRKPYVTFVRKPVYAAMSLLSLLGETQVKTQLINITASPSSTVLNNSNVGVISSVHVPSNNFSSDSWQTTVLIYSSDDTASSTGVKTLNFEWSVYPPRISTEMMLSIYNLSEEHDNPYRQWVKYKTPSFPTLEQFENIRKKEGPHRVSLYPVKVQTTPIRLMTSMAAASPSVLLYHLCIKPYRRPEQVNGMQLINITAAQVLIVWSDKCIQSRCIRTYEVEYSKHLQGPYNKINQWDTIIPQWIYAPPPKPGMTDDDAVRGYYRVRAIDYWSRPGEYGLPQIYPSTSKRQFKIMCT